MELTKQKGSSWKDSQGHDVPVKYIDKGDRLAERLANTLLKEALRINGLLTKFKEKVAHDSVAVFEQKMVDKSLINVKNRKGGFTWTSFDGGIKIETTISELFSFDDALMIGAKECFDQFVNEKIVDRDDPIRLMINEAFTTTRKGYDPKKLMNLLKYKDKVKNEHFGKALDLLKDAMKVSHTKRYHRIWQRNGEGKYEAVELNFSSL